MSSDVLTLPSGIQQSGNALMADHPLTAKLRVLLVEDNVNDGELILRELRREYLEVACEVVATESQFREQIQNNCPDIVLADYNLGLWRGIEALAILREECPDVPLIVVSGALGDVSAVECIKQGATDYVLKDSLARLSNSIKRALKERDLRRESTASAEHLAAKVEELARSNHDLEQFAYVASHDLQEPLRMVAAYTQLLAERYSGKLDEEGHKYIRYAVDGAMRMQTLIQDLLTYSRAGGSAGDWQDTDIGQVLARALDNLQAAIRETSAEIKSGAMPVIAANSSQLLQVFQNLIGNAMKFHGNDPPLIQIRAEKKGKSWLFSVADNGIGIDLEKTKMIFAVFQRLHTRAEYSGNGIGLAICKKIVERHGGKIWVEPSPAHGCIFKFTIPIREQRPLNNGNHDQGTASGRQSRRH